MSAWEILEGDCLRILPTLTECSIDAVVTDPPYELGFMGKAWDGTGIAYSVDLWREVLRVLKPGGHLLSFGGTRTYHRMTCAIEDAGFEIRDSLHWMYGTGFPKSLNVSKELDRVAGAEREVVGSKLGLPGYSLAPDKARNVQVIGGNSEKECAITAPATDAAKQWDGWGTALKPGHEPIVLARKPLEGTVAANVQKWGTGGLNIDGCRIEGVKGVPASPRRAKQGSAYGDLSKDPGTGSGWDANTGRWPSNALFDEDAAAELDAQSGTSKSSAHVRHCTGANQSVAKGKEYPREGKGVSDSGGASRFFYVAKPDGEQRALGTKNTHPTVKPVELMRHLVRLVTPPGGVVLDCFAGSGTTLVAAIFEDVRAIGIEKEPEYAEVARARAGRAFKAAPVTRDVAKAARLDERQQSLFGT